MKKIVASFVFLITFLICVSTSAQTLPRKAWFGVGVAPLDEASATANKLSIGEGLRVLTVVPNATAEALGIKAGDIIISINGKSFAATQDFVAFVATKSEGDPLEANIVSNGEKIVKKGIAKGRAKETSDNAEVKYDAVEMPLGILRTITYIPKNKTGKIPAVFYIQGFPCESQEMGATPKDPRKMAFEDWAKAGFVVFRVERPNLGDSRTSKDCRDIDFNEEIAVNKAGYKKLLGYDFVDPENIFFFGHSMGAYTAPFIAQMKQPKGIMVYGSGVRSWFEYFIDLMRIQPTYLGATHVNTEKTTRNVISFLYEWLELGKSPDELRKNPQFKEIMDLPTGEFKFNGNYFNGRSANFWHTMNKQMTAEAWSKVTAKVLSAHGEFDVQAVNSRDAQLIASIVNEAHPGNGEFILVPKTEHVFMKTDSYRQIFEIIASGKYLEYGQNNYNPEIGRITTEWMQKSMK